MPFRRKVYFCFGPDSKPCYLCAAGGGQPVRCCECQQPIGCHLQATPLLCPSCSERRYGEDHAYRSWARTPELREVRDFLLARRRGER